MKKSGDQHGVVFVNRPLDACNPYIEFKVQMNVISKSKSHLLIGLGDKLNSNPDSLSIF